MTGTVSTLEQDDVFLVECEDCGIATQVSLDWSASVTVEANKLPEDWMPRRCPNCGGKVP